MKPHLYMNKGFWICNGTTCRSVATTMKRAYAQWATSALRNGMLWIDM